MEKYLDIAVSAYSGYWNYLVGEVLHPSWTNWFYWLTGLSLLVWGLEIAFPWRKQQSIIRKDFWQDLFYLYFNFFLFSLIGYNAISNVAVEAFSDFLGLFGIKNLVAIQVGTWPKWGQLLLLFVLADFIQWNTHRLLHRFDFLWKFHKLHHSVTEMGFSAHLRFHWMETILYKSIQYIPLAMIGFGIEDFFLVYLFTVVIGHLNHANLNWSYGPFKYIFNNPRMHLLHHAVDLPENHRYGANFGLTLSIWDYLFGTAYTLEGDGNVPVGLTDQQDFPEDTWEQMWYPFHGESEEEVLDSSEGRRVV